MKGTSVVDHVNLYENLAEAQMRLVRTVILYEDQPYSVSAITDHKGDGVFRVYLDPLQGRSKRNPYKSASATPEDAIYSIMDQYPGDYAGLGTALDALLDKNKTRFLRKKMNSPRFNKFRPFPLGMVNTGETGGGKCFFLERQPQRHREQGLTASMVCENLVTLGTKPMNPRGEGGGMYQCTLYSDYVSDMILNKYPSAKDCLDGILDPDVTNEALAFHRLFALVRGPIGMTFLAYKDDVVGVLPNGDLSVVKIGRKFRHTKEAIEELKTFGSITLQ